MACVAFTSVILSQDISMETIESPWNIVPFFVINQKGNAVIDLQKSEIELFINQRNTREFLLFKRDYLKGIQKSLPEQTMIPSENKTRTVYLLFDTIFDNNRGINELKKISHQMVPLINDNFGFVIQSINSLNRLIFMNSPVYDEKQCHKDIEEEIISPYGMNQMAFTKKVKAFSKCLGDLSGRIQKSKAVKFIFIFAQDIRKTSEQLKAPEKNWDTFIAETSANLKKTGAIIFFIIPTEHPALIPDLNKRSNFLYHLAEKSRAITITGNQKKIVEKITRILTGYYELKFPQLHKFGKNWKHMMIRSNRVGVKILSPLKSTPFNTQQKLNNLKEDETRKHKNRILTIPSTKKKLTPSHHTDLKANTSQNELKNITKIDQGLETILGKAGKHIKKELINNSGHLYDSVEKSRSNPRKIHKMLEKIAVQVEKHNDFFEQTIMALSELFTIPQKYPRLFERLIEREPWETRTTRNQKLLEALAIKIDASLLEKKENKTRWPRLLKKLRNIGNVSANHINFVSNFIKNYEKSESDKIRDLIIRYSRQFSFKDKKKFFQQKLMKLNIKRPPINDIHFLKTLTESTSFYRNQFGYLEALFDHNTVMIYIPPGEFQMGVPWEQGAQDESPLHKVYIDGYWISKYETTFAQFDAFCEATNRKKPEDFGRGRKKRPVINVSWYDAQKYCQWMSLKSGLHFRLPSESEWEKAARGTQANTYPWGEEKPDGKRANFADINLLYQYESVNVPSSQAEHRGNLKWMDRESDDGHVYTSPVNKYPEGASPYGVMGMAGNVWEFVYDWYDGHYYQHAPPRNPRGPFFGSYKVTRGGGWDSHAWMMRTTSRAGGDPTKGSDTLGFRIALIKTN